MLDPDPDPKIGLNAYLLDGHLQRNKDSIVIISKTVILGINVLN